MSDEKKTKRTQQCVDCAATVVELRTLLQHERDEHSVTQEGLEQERKAREEAEATLKMPTKWMQWWR